MYPRQSIVSRTERLLVGKCTIDGVIVVILRTLCLCQSAAVSWRGNLNGKIYISLNHQPFLFPIHYSITFVPIIRVYF